MATRRQLRLAGAFTVGTTATFALSEYLHWQASRRCFPSGAEPVSGAGPEAVLVLGYPSRGTGLHPIQRWRTDIAVRSMDRQSGRLVFSGGSRTPTRCEAEVMAEYAQDRHRVHPGQIVLERCAVTTWQNVAYSLGALENAGTIKVASSPMHAARARAYLIKQRPDLASRLCKANDYRFGERPLWKLATVAITFPACGPRAGIASGCRPCWSRHSRHVPHTRFTRASPVPLIAERRRARCARRGGSRIAGEFGAQPGTQAARGGSAVTGGLQGCAVG